jgi:cellulose synthase/poly-beta-1,6-N-acetylglucosamine synthase-like glycosyltransferase
VIGGLGGLTTATVLLVIAVALLAYLASFALAMVLVCVTLLRRRRKPARADTRARGAIAVLVPTHHEGEGLIDAVETLLHQDYEGMVRIHVLVCDESDSSLPSLYAAYPRARRAGDVIALHQTSDRELLVVPCGHPAKRDKLNHALELVVDPFIAILDADHRAEPSWLSSALSTMDREGACAVQSRRRPLAVTQLPQVWDSVQNHLGNEALNAAQSSLGAAVAFTGTTAVFLASALYRHRFADCITEDTWLTFDLAVSGAQVAYDPDSGSYEEVAPTARSFVARRRRWSAGHTHAFLAHLGALLGARIPAPRKLKLILYGQFYLIPLAVTLLNIVIAAYTLVQLPRNLLWLTVLGSVLAAAALAGTLEPARRRLITDLPVAVIFALPQVTLLVVLAYRLSRAEGYYYLLSFPHADRLLWIQAGTMVAPVLLVLTAAWRVGGARAPVVLTYLVTYPLMLFVDIYAGLLGTCDLLTRRSAWVPIERRNVVGASDVPEVMRRRLARATTTRSRVGRWVWVPVAAAFLALANEVLAVDECGQIRPFLWSPLWGRGSGGPVLRVTLDKRLSGVDSLQLEAHARVTGSLRGPLTLQFFLDGQLAERRVLPPEGPFDEGWTRTLPLGFDKHAVEVVLSGPNLTCARRHTVSTTVIEVQGRALRLNGEPFLLKGVVNSFSSPQVGLSATQGLTQLKAIGANAVRVYHQPTPGLLQAAADTHTLIVDQPDESTWLNVDVTRASDRTKLGRRYRRLLEETEGDPFIIIDNLGNELDLQRRELEAIEGIRTALDEARARGARSPLAFSTYKTFIDYPVDALGINMLDTSETYWSDALAMVARRGRPFYASELGGFVAYRESPPTEVRIGRLKDYWGRLLRAGAFGACIFQSHDNWAQSVIPGAYNDPLVPEQPDDLRGLWDHLNQPKTELRFVERLFADLEVSVSERRLDDVGAAHLVFRNRRAYALEQVTIDAPALSIGDLSAGEQRTVEVDARALRGVVGLQARYLTHHGLRGESRLALHVPRATTRPVVLSDDFIEERADDPTVRGRVVDVSDVEVVLPAGWSAARINGRLTPADADGRVHALLAGARHAVRSLQVSADGRSWRPFDASDIGGGEYVLRFELPALPAGTHYLVLAGLGAQSVDLSIAGRRLRVETHAYRESHIDLAQLAATAGQTVELTIDRQMLVYVPGTHTPDGADLPIVLEPPRVHTIQSLEIGPP